MSIKGIGLKQSLGRNIQAIMPQDDELNLFTRNLISFLQVLHDKPNESEEFQKAEIKKFLSSCLPDNYINTSERVDLAVYNGKKPTSTVGIILESKSVMNVAEMMTKDRINSKAFQETVHYYLNERIVNKNLEIKKCIITNGYSWFTIEAKEYEKFFVNNKVLLDLYEKWRLGQLASTKTDFLYKEVIKPEIDIAIDKGITIAHFDLNSAIQKSNPVVLNTQKVTQLFRFFTPENLLNKEIFSDSNKLNKSFYDELLYIMGLEEITRDKKKVIVRLTEEKRQYGSFVENAIDRLDTKEISKELQTDYAIQLTVVWINRILFLKLLESQLVSFNKNRSFEFLTYSKIKTFDDLFDLFFGVLARKEESRSDRLKHKFVNVPYLNSSLFEESTIEKKTLDISDLRDEEIELFSRTSLKTSNNKRKTGKINILQYLFSFLESYDFSTATIHRNESTNELINASVLGLIFEKINGYKDGSFYTPGKITMYMSRKAVRKSVLTRINEEMRWTCKNIEEVKFMLSSKEDRKNVNEAINKIRICDPAVGSGHFLVSALNELIVIKSELRCLFYPNGEIMTDVTCTIVNDELVIQDLNGKNFSYVAGNSYFETIQKTIFNEKREIIENCLFGVDLNPNSVNICRLRLWIELLKNSFYQNNEITGNAELVTLPNIDINIKQGNSLLHKFSFTDDFDKRRKNYKEYFSLVKEYKNTNDKKTKSEIIEQIGKIKLGFSNSLYTPERADLGKLIRQKNEIGTIDLFATSDEIKKQEAEIKEINIKIGIAEKKVEEAEQNPLFKGGMEWRMEFPEILDDDGVFTGFDLIIANPPYIYSSDDNFTKSEKKYFTKTYPLIKYQANTFGLFMELGYMLLRENGYMSFIIPNTFLTINQYQSMRSFLIENCGDLFILNSKDKIFDEASVDNCIINASKAPVNTITLAELENEEIIKVAETIPSEMRKFDVINITTFKENNADYGILSKIERNSVPLEKISNVKDGLKAYERGKGNPSHPTDEKEFKEFKRNKPFSATERLDATYRKFLEGPDVQRYSISWSGQYLKYGDNLAAKRNPAIFEGIRIIIARIPVKASYAFRASITDAEYVHEQSIESISDIKLDPYFVLGCLNSKVVSYYSLQRYDFLQRKTFPQMRLTQIKKFPIPKASDKEMQIVSSLVRKLLDLYSNEINLSLEEKRLVLQLEKEIDHSIMSLFRLTNDEKNIIEKFEVK
ncbi:type II restriction endonuclease [Listeria monocytogenes]|uniref:type IIG restriction enzyme/methyltransferase n=1 Tax=Enterococcus TaxID=1350 RepID=UPI00115D26FF|nr:MULTISPECIES: TaqI-like C-terminal specificity domain-containing protein [Enterococcus]EAF9272243.1 type II restriction endonuclease [Listeria monocytogenes]EAG1002523.1 type II restriction endonuclease [Listeria monocytogenes]MBU5367090.1 Eco57I restriction-modification methylase domain-containing protein [Enterococcus avium]